MGRKCFNLRLLLRVLLFPVAFLMTLLLVPLALLLALSTRVLAILSSICVTLAVLLFLSGNRLNGVIFLLMAWLISPYGLPLAAEWLWKRMADVRGILWQFVFER